MDGRVEGANAWGATAGSTDRRRASGSGAAGVVARAMPGVVVMRARWCDPAELTRLGGAGWKSRTAGGDQTTGTVGRDGGGREGVDGAWRVGLAAGATSILAAGWEDGGGLQTHGRRYGGQGSVNQFTQAPFRRCGSGAMRQAIRELL